MFINIEYDQCRLIPAMDDAYETIFVVKTYSTTIVDRFLKQMSLIKEFIFLRESKTYSVTSNNKFLHQMSLTKCFCLVNQKHPGRPGLTSPCNKLLL